MIDLMADEKELRGRKGGGEMARLRVDRQEGGTDGKEGGWDGKEDSGLR